MDIRFTCPNGHRLRASDRDAGRITRCGCGCKVTIPARESSPVTDSCVMRYLDELPPVSPVQALVAGKICPRCGVAMSAKQSRCEGCRLYVIPMLNVWSDELSAAMRDFFRWRRKTNDRTV